MQLKEYFSETMQFFWREQKGLKHTRKVSASACSFYQCLLSLVHKLKNEKVILPDDISLHLFNSRQLRYEEIWYPVLQGPNLKVHTNSKVTFSTSCCVSISSITLRRLVQKDNFFIWIRSLSHERFPPRRFPASSWENHWNSPNIRLLLDAHSNVRTNQKCLPLLAAPESPSSVFAGTKEKYQSDPTLVYQ